MNYKTQVKSAFPTTTSDGYENPVSVTADAGMLLVDYFAAKAMQIMLSDCINTTRENYAGVAKVSYSMAEAMMTERERRLAVNLPDSDEVNNDTKQAEPPNELTYKSNMSYSAKHIPTGETWHILGISKGRNQVCAAGWPPTIASLSDCTEIGDEQPLTHEELVYRSQQFGTDW